MTFESSDTNALVQAWGGENISHLTESAKKKSVGSCIKCEQTQVHKLVSGYVTVLR